jgi:hypothetical protein
MSLFPADNGENDLFMSRTDPENPFGTHAAFSLAISITFGVAAIIVKGIFEYHKTGNAPGAFAHGALVNKHQGRASERKPPSR